ncbi:hypothetical protein [Fusibacter ferrireducens]|uniref:DUF2577 domain-containing protein n=1 Tax=Fusibacter ferrireducens TaxID=2785058 RepID=A0ABR9ZTV8_9FIRM|nr:hypothetical protein [Fusibacter ferrireducens]MBF4693898.1 hypothetical protein [Fusibacter ferrireducens]
MAGEKLIRFIKNQDKGKTEIEIGTVLSDPPNVSVKLDNMKVAIPRKFLVLDYNYAQPPVKETYVGHRVAVMSLENGNRYYLIGRVVE